MRSLRTLNGFVCTLLVVFGLTPFVQGQVATTTQLVISAPTVEVGVPTLLTATVTDAASHSVHLGTVTFYDGTRSLGSAQIVSGTSGAYPQGTANLKTASFSAGANSITAVFAGTKSDLKSTSTAKTVTVTGKYPTTTALSGYVTGTDFWLTATLKSFGLETPTGYVDFSHISNGVPVATIDTKPLSGATWGTDLTVNSPVGLSGSLTDSANSTLDTLAVGDFNGDGLLDVAASIEHTAGDYTVVVLLGNGKGGFKTPTSFFSAGVSPLGIYAADFNNDGKLDVLVTHVGGIGILLGNGDGTLQPEVEYSAGESGNALVYGYIADLNRDGNLDVVSVGQADTGPYAIVLQGNGDGTFQPQSTYAAGGPGFGNYEVEGGDLNGDGILDLVVANERGVGILLGKGDGTFLPLSYSYTISIGSRVLPYTLADINNDGKLDLVFYDGVALGRGDGTFVTGKTFPLVENPAGKPVVVDINEDGKPDIVIETISSGYQFSEQLNLLFGNGDGTFQIPALYPLGYGAVTPGFSGHQGPVLAADFNGDGRPDLVVSNLFNNRVSSVLNQKTASLQVARDGLGPNTTTFQADYAGDGNFTESVSSAVPLSQASIDYSGGFSGAGTGLKLNDGAAVTGGVLQLTKGANQATSVYSSTPVNIRKFVTDFTFQMPGTTPEGLTFVIQSVGPSAVGSSGAGLGYQGISKSIGVKFDTYNFCIDGYESTGLYVDGPSLVNPCFRVPELFGKINLNSGDPFRVHITYDGTYLAMTITDTVTLATQVFSTAIDIPHAVAGSTAYVGFTAGTGSQSAAATVSSWRYLAETPPPNFPLTNTGGFQDSTGLQLNGTTVMEMSEYGNTVSLTQSGANQAGSLFYTAPQNVQAFTTDFTFGVGPIDSFLTGSVSDVADGITFAIQNAGPQALGGLGGSLGYKGIPKSVAIKFDFFNDSGEGNSSTGLYLDGASPTVPAVDMSGSGLTLGVGAVFDAHITYDGETLTLTLVNSSARPIETFTHSWAVDIPAVVGGTTAYVGFTGSTGFQWSYDVVDSWTYLPGVN